MRLICPNCDAQYEVDDDAIPEAGRDVQCSNCGHGWYQYRPDSVPDDPGDDLGDDPDAAFGEAPAAEDGPPAGAESPAPGDMPDDPGDPGPGQPRPEAEAGPEPEADPVPDPVPGADPAEVPEAEALIAAMIRSGTAPAPETAAAGPAAGEAAATPMRRSLDDSLLSVLREEAEREAEARRAEAAPRPLETQPDLGLTEQRPVRRIVPAPEPAARTDGDDPAHAAAGPRGARRDLLPDIEEINSTLRPSTERRGQGAEATLPEPPEARRKGFRIGFVGMMAIALILLGLYAAAPRLATSVPALETPLRVYVAAVDKGRIGLDALMQRALGAMQGDGGD